MNVLIACEESQRVCAGFRRQGHSAFSCDIQTCSGGFPEWHIMQDVIPLLNGNCTFKTLDGKQYHINGKWDMIIAFPPCTDLAVSGARHFEQKRLDGRQQESIEFFCKFLQADCEKIAIENPVNVIGGEYVLRYFPDIARKYGLPRKPTQYIQPFYFGDKTRKKTCLWLKGLPELIPTDIVEPELDYYVCSDGRITSFSPLFSKVKDAKLRSKTFMGIAKAMSEQWG